MNPPASLEVVVVSDYETGSAKTWDDERRILEALAGQDTDEPFAAILVENMQVRDSVPDDLRRILPHLSIVFSEASRSAELKDCGVAHSQAEYVAVFEADCVPNRCWLRVALDVLRRRPDISIVSGRTTYGRESAYRRCLGLIDRSFDDLGRPGATSHVSNNGALYRRSVLAKFPYPEAATPFQSARMRMNQMRRARINFWFDPEAVMRHAIGGWDFMRDFRRNTGYADMAMHSKKSASEIPRLLWRRLIDERDDCLRLGPQYLEWRDWPLLLALMICARCLEIPGMLDALKGRDRISRTAYR